MGIRKLFRKKEKTGFYSFQYCSKCGTKHDKDLNFYVGGALKVFLGSLVCGLMVFGIMFVYMASVNPYYLMIPIVSVSNFQYTQIANEFHPEVQEIADNITAMCEMDYPDQLKECKLGAARRYVVNNFEYANDWEGGYANGFNTYNMILSERARGDCIEYSITFCSLVNHLGFSCIVRSPNGAHRISIVKVDSVQWVPIDPQNNLRAGVFIDDTFQGFLI